MNRSRIPQECCPTIWRDEALASIRNALALLAVRLAKNSDYGIYVHANEQLTRMIVELGYPFRPFAASREWVDIGLMAAKELDDTDPEFANALMQADFDFKHAE